MADHHPMSVDVVIADDKIPEYMFDTGWTDGLPVVPPTPERVERMLECGDLDRMDTVGEVPARDRHVTAEKAAINAVMAGCRPEYFPAVLAALRACLAPAFNAHTAFSSTGGAATCLIVSGDYARKIGMNSGPNLLGPGNRPNASIGRAVRLIARNVLGARSDAMDASSIGHPGKYTFCFAEEPPPAPWMSLSEQFGMTDGESIIIAMATEGPHQIGSALTDRAEDILRTIAAAMRVPSRDVVGQGGQGIVVLGPEHRETVRAQGWTQAAVRQYLATRAALRTLRSGRPATRAASSRDSSSGLTESTQLWEAATMWCW
jgi:hypothetical protein